MLSRQKAKKDQKLRGKAKRLMAATTSDCGLINEFKRTNYRKNHGKTMGETDGF
jgi:hypothetical protein